MRTLVTVLGVALVIGSARHAGAQTIGTFSWRLEPFCNTVRFTVTADGPQFRLTGADDGCGTGQVPAAGVVTPNADGTFTLAFYLITPQGLASHTTATLGAGSYSGPWKDDGELTGTLTFNLPPAGGGTPRPVAGFQRRVTGLCTGTQFVQKVLEDGSVECGVAAGGSGDVTGVGAGVGLVGGGASGDVTLAVATGGIGSAQIADRSIAAADVDPTQVQRRIVTTCTPGLYFSQVLESGGAVCSDGAPMTSTALGEGVLAANTGTANTAVGGHALGANTTGNSGTAVGFEALTSNTTGANNTALGARALTANTSGLFNTALGSSALAANTTGRNNTALGANALSSNFTGNSNVGVGQQALGESTAGAENTAVGWFALPSNTTGNFNVAIGANALDQNTTGASNIAIGRYAGSNLTTGDENIVIGHSGVAGDADTIRIGGGPQTRAFIDGIRGVTTGVANAVAVVIDSAGQLGTISSSRRTKDDIRDMGDASAGLFRLRPVTFRYIQSYADGSRPRDYGLIAEEVDEVYPDLVVRNETGEVETVQYHKLVPMLLNELQRLQREIQALHVRLAVVEAGSR